MALAPAFRAHRIGPASSLHTLELFLDLNCPFSAKQFKGVEEHLLPLLREKGAEDKLSIIIRVRCVPTPKTAAAGTLMWKGSTANAPAVAPCLHLHPPICLAVAALDPPSLLPCFSALLSRQSEFFDDKTVDETPNQTKERLAVLAEEVSAGKVGRDKVLELVKTGEGNSGAKVDKELKLAVKYHRQLGVHVTPTVALDGLIDPSVSSSFGKEEWRKYLDEKVLGS